MNYCKKCVMPDTRPGIYFDEVGICQACRAEEQKDLTNWNERRKNLDDICNKYRRNNEGEYDCIIAVSGGKDSHFQVHYFKEIMNMNPLLVSVEDNFEMTSAGKHNLQNISERFGCHLITLKPNRKAQKAIMKKTFEKYGKPTWYIDRLIYTYPLHIANKFNIPLIIYGENISYEYGGKERIETYSAKNQLNNGVASDIPYDELLDDNISINDLIFCKPPNQEVIDKLNPIYLSYFVRWNSYANYIFAKKNGFKDLSHEWTREHTFENFDQIETPAYLIHPWLKYPKFGHASATDYASKFIRYGLISRDEGIDLVKKYDHRIDQRSVKEFCDFLGYTLTDFYSIIDSFYNNEIFEKNKFGEWVLKNPIWEN
ncbi:MULTISPECIES: N-acetyl sugar amidotransferase [Lysinibacillus]|uniref:N-acetyl sugar amidotransferase n=1 Tax=Lysinibacillus TaxID=400634 RepID=UPI00214B6CF2|nr:MULTISPECIES: N-acetyl sugar amidotransferase [Lysinibacillus]UUV25139.1 N-acetyl sugar amidotransferase [Lysinibacillus sp. FN11]UYB48011.1 N-acetyl sugar amidotransferase [Lysinibacillus capsici]